MKQTIKKVSNKLFILLAVLFCVIGILLSTTAANASVIANEYLLLDVQSDNSKSAYGCFKLKKAMAENESTLTYSQYYSAYTTLSINGKVYRFEDGQPVGTTRFDGNKVTTVSDFDGVEVMQELFFDNGNSSVKDMLSISYTAKNYSDRDVLLSARIIIDPTLDNSESGTIQTDSGEFINEKTITDNIPENWYIKDNADSIIAYGRLLDSCVKPDAVQFADWTNLFDQRIGLITDSTSKIKDNAVAVLWNNKTIEKGCDFSFSTKYGLYSEDEPVIEPTTAEPTTAEPTTVEPTTVEPTTVEPTTVEPTTIEPTTVAPTTVAPTTVAPTTVAPTTVAPTTVAPTTVAPTTLAPTTVEPTTVAPTTVAPTTVAPTTVAPTTVAPTTVAPTTVAPTTVAPTTVAPTTVEATTKQTEAPSTVVPATEATVPTTVAPATTVEAATQAASTQSEIIANTDNSSITTGNANNAIAIVMFVMSGICILCSIIIKKREDENK